MGGMTGKSIRGNACGAVAALFALAASLPAQSPTRTVQGKLADHRGARFQVTLWHDDMDRHSLDAIGETISDAEGRFCIVDAPWPDDASWGSHKIVLVARAKGRIALLELRGSKAAREPLQVTVHDTVEVTGRMFDAQTGQPVQTGWIWPSILRTPDEVWLTRPLGFWRAQTDERGAFVIKGLPKGASVKFLAGGRDHARTWVPADATDIRIPSDRPLDVEVPRGGRIHGRVLRPDGKPAARALVVTTSRGVGYGQTWSDDDGHFELSALMPGEYKVWAEVPDLTVVCVQGVRIRAGDVVRDQVVQLVHGGLIVGKILDAATGKPFEPGPWTDVAMYGPARGDGGSCECTKVDKHGTFRIRAPAGKNRIYLRAARGYDEPSEIVDVVEGVQTEVIWRVHRGGKAAKRPPQKPGGDKIGT